MSKNLFLLLLWLVLLIPNGVFAQAEIRFSSIEVDLWPEYDRPSMLVIYRMVLGAETPLPASVNLRIPVRIGVPNAVAARQPDGSLINIPYDLQESGDWEILSFNAPTPEIQFEYYDPALTKNGNRREFEFFWHADFAVDRFLMQVQQPMGASGMQISPSFGNGTTAGDGFVYYTSEIGSIPVGEAFTVRIEYQKDSDDLSLSGLPISPSGPLEEETTAGLDWQELLPWILGIIGVALLVGGGIWYWRSGKVKAQPQISRYRNRKKPDQMENIQDDESDGFIYCHQCGKRASTGDRFCRACGTQLRKN